MTDDTTTIEITNAQKAELDDVRDATGADSYKAAVGELLNSAEFPTEGINEVEAERIAERVVERELRKLG